MWAFLIGLAVSVAKTFATSAASSAGTKLGEAIFSNLGEERKQVVVAGSQPSATREQQISASRQLLSALNSNVKFRDECRAILANHAPSALAEGEQVQKQLDAAPAITEQVVSGIKPVTDFYMDPAYIWSQMSSVPISRLQTAFLRSPSFHRICPIGGEDLGFGPEVMGAIEYVDTRFSNKVKLPTSILPGSSSDFVARCKNGHSWPVFQTG